MEQASWGELEAGGYALSASVVNYGYADRTNITVELRKGAKDGPVVDTASISALEPLELEVVSFTLADPQDDVYYFTLRDSGDVYTMNDSDFAALGLNFASQFADIISVTSTQTELKLNNSQAGTCMVAIYDGSGRMLSVGSARRGGQRGHRPHLLSAVCPEPGSEGQGVLCGCRPGPALPLPGAVPVSLAAGIPPHGKKRSPGPPRTGGPGLPAFLVRVFCVSATGPAGQAAVDGVHMPPSGGAGEGRGGPSRR